MRRNGISSDCLRISSTDFGVAIARAVGKPLQQHAQPCEVIEMAVGDVDRGELATVKRNPVGKLRLSFGDGHQCVDENGVIFPEDQCRGARIKRRREA